MAILGKLAFLYQTRKELIDKLNDPKLTVSERKNADRKLQQLDHEILQIKEMINK